MKNQETLISQNIPEESGNQATCDTSTLIIKNGDTITFPKFRQKKRTETQCILTVDLTLYNIFSRTQTFHTKEIKTLFKKDCKSIISIV